MTLPNQYMRVACPANMAGRLLPSLEEQGSPTNSAFARRPAGSRSAGTRGMVAPQGTMSSQVAATLAAASANELAEFGAFPAGSAKSDRAPVALPPRRWRASRFSLVRPRFVIRSARVGVSRLRKMCATCTSWTLLATYFSGDRVGNRLVPFRMTRWCEDLSCT